jgi:hypothetical protein
MKEMGPQHSQMEITLGVGISKCFEFWGTKLQMEKLVQIEHSLYHLKVIGM